MSFYGEMAEMVQEMLLPDADGGLGQGVVSLKRVTTAAPHPDTPWEPGAPTEATYPLKASVRRVSQQYVDGVLIVATDQQVTFSVPSVVPLLTDLLVIDGASHAIKDIRPIPAAGVPVAYVAFVAA